ncbi:hypothetical protein FOS14_03435 [Skermania sp. ID1734]|uniref:linalool dehydratase/isomerase domain-containing protein n=1 Tax=Skermania sp. ID1734 TaxID=2597516 RepID=UPI00117C8F74|nr:hypothetical protein [Skermania sp. ID1734]TSE01598.1 hypothetical protein FOS14_03435 [Skermania sp. ID1734]
MDSANTSPVPANLPVAESNADDLATQCYFLDLLLQPLDEWRGFQVIEQFGLSGIRYELNFSQYALAMAQYTRTPAFTGYLAEAQRNAILKMTNRRVWSYWAIERLVGYGRWNPDPIVFHNIMYTAYFGMMIGLYETLNDDRRFSAPGSLTLRWNERKSYRYEFAGIANAIRVNMLQEPDHPQYPCEPRLVYPVCNTFALNTLRLHDRLHGTNLTGDLIERVRLSYDKDGWRRKNGRFLSCGTRSGRPLVPPSLFNDGSIASLLNPTMPDVAENTWRVLRNKCITITGEDVELERSVLDRIDAGNYNVNRGDAQARSCLMMGACEHGDDEALNALDRSIAARHDVIWSHGARQFKGLSPWSYGSYALGRWGRRNSMRDLVNGVVPLEWRTGPLLAQVAYPDVLVAKAVTDGAALELVLRPGNGPTRATLKFARLSPGRTYHVSGATVDQLIAATDGTALAEVDLAGRCEVRVWPAA